MSHYIPCERDHYPKVVRDLARTRTEGLLFTAIRYPVSLQTVVESAYLQGLSDMAESVIERDMLETQV